MVQHFSAVYIWHFSQKVDKNRFLFCIVLVDSQTRDDVYWSAAKMMGIKNSNSWFACHAIDRFTSGVQFTNMVYPNMDK